MTERGRLRFYDEARGFGFIQPDDGGGDVFVNQVVWHRCPDVIQRHDEVEYDAVPSPNGRPRATRIRLA